MSRFSNLEFGDQSKEKSDPAPLVKEGAYYLEQAKSAFQNGRFEEALRSYAKVLEFEPASAIAWAGQVRMLIELGEFEEANIWADKALESFPEEPELLAAKAVALARCGDTQAALPFSDAAVAGRGDVAYVWLARGDVLLARAEKRADFCFEKALQLAGLDWTVPWLISRVYSFYRKSSRALSLAQKALAMDAGRAVLWLQFGRCQLALGLAQAASHSFEQARELDPVCRPEAAEVRALSETGWWARWAGWWRQAFAK